VWGLSYQWLGGGVAWKLVAGALTLAGLALLVPRWWHDLKDRTSLVPLSLPLTICVNSVISPYMLGYEHVVLLLPALVYLACAGLPGDEASASTGRDRTLWRLAIFAWMGVLPWLVLAVQGVIDREYPAVAQSAAMLAICWVATLVWGTRSDRELASGSNT
jgi:hypothetical protein